MSDPSDPQWDLLPDHPEPFFGLSGEYDVRDLKRSYNAFIRKFKPEKFPAEFQKIRAAYERLDDALRYGETSSPNQNTADWHFNWSEVLQGQPEPESPAVPRQPPVNDYLNEADAEPVFSPEGQPLHERVRNEPLAELYQELKTQDDKSPYDFYALAFLSDLLERHSQSFPMWLLQGLQAHPGDPALFELLHQYFVTCESLEGLEELLVNTSRVVRSDRFYYLTENAWDRLLRHTSFHSFQHTLDACESNLLDYQVAHLLVFYIHILKAAIWKADIAWLNSKFSLIETNLVRLPPWLEYEFHFLDLMRVYQRERSLFLTGGPLRITIDQTIQDYCIQSEQQADQSFLECQQLLVSQRNELLDEFGVNDRECETVQILWEKIADDVFERISTRPPIPATESLQQRTRRLVAQLSEKESGTDYRRSLQIPRLGFLLFLTISIMIILLGMLFEGESINAPYLIIGCLLMFNGVAFVLSSVISEHIIRAFYISWWRKNLMQFYQSDWVPLMVLAVQLNQLKEKHFKKNKAYNLDQVARYMVHDVSLYFYTTAQRLLTACE
ncbi:MAG: hypothetical protein KDA70_15575 [Planctomycetaceae bacterium]|nr:hypothetical protein [Planctomycetaceae bacterium]